MSALNLCYCVDKTSFTSNYEYRGEGNAHLALFLAGCKKILLIGKSTSPEADGIDDWEKSIDFHNNIMRALLFPFVEKVIKVSISMDEIKQIENNISTMRPIYRRHKALSSKRVALISDYTLFPFNSIDSIEQLATFAFEIKPKCAVDIDGSCRFCLKQKDKLQSGRIKQTTEYCPKDLFSGDIERLHKALKCLISNPQNNLQIYKNSKLIYSEEHHKMQLDELEEHFACWGNTGLGTMHQLLSKILLFKYECTKRCSSCKGFPQFTILERILQLQELNTHLNKPITTEKGYVDLLLTQTNLPNSDFCKRCNVLKHLEKPLVQYYISKIARDCSLMIIVKQVPKEHNESFVKNVYVINIEGMDYIFDAKVLDLFPKKEN